MLGFLVDLCLRTGRALRILQLVWIERPRNARSSLTGVGQNTTASSMSLTGISGREYLYNKHLQDSAEVLGLPVEVWYTHAVGER